MEDIVIGCTNPDDRRNLPSPEGEAVGVDSAQLMADRSNMVNESQVLGREEARVRSWKDVETGEWEDSGLLPLLDLGLDLRSPHEIRLVRAGRPVVRQRHVVVGTSNLVLRAVAALWEVLITPDVAALASFTSLPGLGVAPTRRTTTGTGHCNG
jgi:hypothetical protein